MLSDNALIQNILGCIRREVLERGQNRARIDREIESRRRRVEREDGGDTGRTVNTRIKNVTGNPIFHQK